MTQTITAYFDTRTEAQSALDRLADHGISGADAVIHDQSSTVTAGTGTREEKGFFEFIGDWLMGDDDRETYAEGVRRGGSVVTVRCTDDQFDAVCDILEAEGAVDLDEKANTWETDGWQRPSLSQSDDYEMGSVERLSNVSRIRAGSAGTVAATSTQHGAQEPILGDRGYGENRDGTIEVVQENLRGGRRDVSHGRVRVRSYVGEEPVSQDISLRSENVEISRPAVGAVDAFSERTIEPKETDADAVVSKDARVVSEIDLKPGVHDRAETISDTVHHTEIDIADERASETLSDADRARRGL